MTRWCRRKPRRRRGNRKRDWPQTTAVEPWRQVGYRVDPGGVRAVPAAPSTVLRCAIARERHCRYVSRAFSGRERPGFHDTTGDEIRRDLCRRHPAHQECRPSRQAGGGRRASGRRGGFGDVGLYQPARILDARGARRQDGSRVLAGCPSRRIPKCSSPMCVRTPSRPCTSFPTAPFLSNCSTITAS